LIYIQIIYNELNNFPKQHLILISYEVLKDEIEKISDEEIKDLDENSERKKQ
jgi:hypothetical protein